MPTIADLSVKLSVEGVDTLDKGLKGAASSVGDLGKRVNQTAGQYDGAAGKMTAANSKIGQSSKNAGKAVSGSFSGAAKSLDGMSNSIAGAFTIGALLSFGSAVINITAEFQKLEAVLTNTLGSNGAAKTAMLQIEAFAATTPYSVAEATGAFLKLQNSGLKPTMSDMRAFGDLAANAGKGLDMMAEAVNDAARGEFERLKEFFVDASVKGDKVALTFKGVATEVDNNAESIKKYLVALGESNGVAGATDKISATLGGRLNNLKDSWDRLLKTVGNSSGALSGAADFFAFLIDKSAEALKGVDQVAKEKAMKGASNYKTNIEQTFKEIAETAKKSGADVNKELDSFAKAEVTRKTAQIAFFKKELAGLQGQNVMLDPSNYSQRQQFTANSEDIERHKRSIAQYELENKAIKEVYTTFLKGPGATAPLITTLDTLNKKLDQLEGQQQKINVADTEGLVAKNKEIEAVKALIKKYEGLGGAKTKAASIKVPPAPEIEPPRIADEIKKLKFGSGSVEDFLGAPKIGPLGEDVAPVIPPGLDELPAQLEKAKSAWDIFQEDVIGNAGTIQQVIADGLGGAFDLLASSIGTAFSGQGDIFANIEKQVRDFAKQYGQFLIKWGLGAIITTPPLGIAAIAAGGALMAFGGGGGGAKGGSKGISSGNSSYSSPTNRARTDSFSNGAVPQIQITGETRVAGADIIISYERAQAQNNRRG